MRSLFFDVATRFRVLSTRMLRRAGMHESSFLMLPAVLIGLVVAAAAVSFHELILLIRQTVYGRWEAGFLYGGGMWLLILIPMIGGLIVGILVRFFGGGGHGVPEVIESVIKTQGFIRPVVAIQKIITASTTIGTGGSAGAEGPIVQVGAAIASGVGRVFAIARDRMPLLVACGTAAGISSVFNAPIGGVLFTLEVILQDFSIRAFTPLMIASVVANVTTRAIFHGLNEPYRAIFAVPSELISKLGSEGMLEWHQLPNFALLGIACGLVAAALTGMMRRGDELAERLPIPKLVRPAVGGMAVGGMGVLWVVLGSLVLGTPKPFSFEVYPLPAFFGDGYGVIHELLRPSYYASSESTVLLLMLLTLCGAKILATCLTLCSGGSGGVIAPSLVLGATTGAVLGMGLERLSIFSGVSPAIYALVGMGAVLGAVVHAPLAAILILLELVSDYRVITPAMLATIFAVGIARFLARDSIYSHDLRAKGILPGSTRDASLLRRLTIERLGMDPAMIIPRTMPLPEVLKAMGETISDAVVADERGLYVGILRRQDIETALLQPDSIPLLLAGELAKSEIPAILSSDDLTRALEVFQDHDVATLAVGLPDAPLKVVGVVGHQSLVRRYHDHVVESV